jgi:hypothetical protein
MFAALAIWEAETNDAADSSEKMQVWASITSRQNKLGNMRIALQFQYFRWLFLDYF